MAVTHSAIDKFVTVSLPKRLRIITAVSLLKPPPGSRSGLKEPVGTSRNLYISLYIIVLQGRDDGRGYRNVCKIPRGSDLNQGGWGSITPYGALGAGVLGTARAPETFRGPVRRTPFGIDTCTVAVQ
jgi:hypothetical protein